MACPSPETDFKPDRNPSFTNNVDDDAGESDYGSDFTPDEEELLNALLVKVANGDTTTAATATETETTAVVTGNGNSGPEVVDIEDYERVWRGAPKVLGRVQLGWEGEVQQQQQQQQRAGSTAVGEFVNFLFLECVNVVDASCSIPGSCFRSEGEG